MRLLLIFHASVPLVATPTLMSIAIWFPRLPQFLYSIVDETDDDSNFRILRIGLVIFESYIFVTVYGPIAICNILICMTYKSLSNYVKVSISRVKLDPTFSVSQLIISNQCFQLVTARLKSVFSASILGQEFGFMVVIELGMVDGSKLNSQKFGFLSAYFYAVCVELWFLVTFQFHPIIFLNSNSIDFITSCLKSLMYQDKYSKTVVQGFRELKIRPMGVHTITVGTLGDYVVFVISFVLMLHQA